MCDSVNRCSFPKEDRLPDWVRRDKHGNKGDRVDRTNVNTPLYFWTLPVRQLRFKVGSVTCNFRRYVMRTCWYDTLALCTTSAALPYSREI
jgi:hypothetical protein